MTTTTKTDPDHAALPESVRAEAAVWVALLHSDQRSEETERSFRAWLAGSPLRAAAFERMTNTWEATSNLRREALALVLDAPPVQPRPVQRRRGALAAAAMLAVCAAIGFLALMLPPEETSPQETIATTLGERRSLQLADGSRLILNTDSHVTVTLSSTERLITLLRGQARFEVAKDARRPFVVRAGGKQIVAHGTQFDVRWTDERLAIVLFEGHVSVTHALQPVSSEGIDLKPGERLYFAQPTLAVKSAPSLDREEAWLAGRAIFDKTLLRDAVAEMNRYARRPLQLGDPALADLPISGTFSVDEPEVFARALADMLSLHIEHSGQSLVLQKQATSAND